MTVALTINNTTIDYPQVGDQGWGNNATRWAQLVTTGMLQKAGGIFQLLADVDFGNTFGLKANYFSSRTTNIATAGVVRLAKTDTIDYKNNANDGNLALGINSSDELIFNGSPVQNIISILDTSTINLTLASRVLSADIVALSITNSLISASAGIVYSKLNLSNSIVNADVNTLAAIAVSKLASGTAAQVLLNNSTPTPTWTTISGDSTISSTGVSTVTKVNGTSYPAGGSLTTGQIPRVTGVSSVDYGALDLANTSAVTGILPAANQETQTLVGDVSGTTTASTVDKIKNITVSIPAHGVSQDGYVLTYVDGSTDFKLKPSPGTGLIVGTIDSQTKSANGQVIIGPNIFSQTADDTFPGLVSTTAQTIAGDKTFTGALQYATSVSSPSLKQVDKTTNSGVGSTLTVQAQNETGTTSTGGNLTLTSGTGTTIAGNVLLQTGGTNKVTVSPTDITFHNSLGNDSLTVVTSTSAALEFATGPTSVKLFQADKTTNSVTGNPLTIQAQNETGTSSTGGSLNLTSGTGTTIDGYVNLQVGGTTTASVVPNKLVLNKGLRHNITSITSGGTYNVLATDDVIAINTLTASFQINLPASPVIGDTYEIKDGYGGASSSNVVTISGNGKNIDGYSAVNLNYAFESIVVTYTGTQYSIITGPTTMLPIASVLTSLVGSFDGQMIAVAGRTVVNDGGQGTFIWVAGSAETADQAIIYGATAFGRWRRLVGSGPIDPRWFGSVTAATINSALAAAVTLNVGTVLVQKGSYTVTGAGSDRIKPISNTTLIFEPGCTISTGALTATSIVMFIDSTTTDVENVCVEGNGLLILCSRAEAQTCFGISINIQNPGDICRNIRLSNIKVASSRTDGVILGGNTGAFMTDIILTGITTTDCGRNGMSLTGQVNGATFIDCHFDSNGTVSAPKCGVDVEVDPGLEIRNLKFIRCTFDSNAAIGVYNQGPTVGVTSKVSFTDCQANSNTTVGFDTTCPETSLINCTAKYNGTYGFFTQGDTSLTDCKAESNTSDGFHLIDSNSRTVVTGCASHYNGGNGFLLNSFAGSTGSTTLDNCHSYTNILRGFHLTGAWNAQLNSCRATTNFQEGILFSNSWHCSASDCLSTANSQISDNGADNILLETASSLNRVTNNQIRQSANFHHGTAVSGTTTSVVLGAPSSDANDLYVGLQARIISGTASGGTGMITAYVGSSRTVSVVWSPAVAPDGTSVIEITGTRIYNGPVTSSTSTVVTLPTELAPSINDIFNGAIFKVVSGTGAGQSLTVSDYNGTTRELTVSGTLSPVPISSSVVSITAIIRPRYGFKINSGCVGNSAWGNDAYYGGVTAGFSDGGTSTVTTSGNRVT